MLPAFAFASEISPVFSRKAISLVTPVMVLATVAIGFIGIEASGPTTCSR